MNDDLLNEIKNLIISALALEDLKPEDIAADTPLFGEGLGLDSIDALELALAVTKQYGVKLDEDSDAIREHFYSVNTLAAMISSRRSSAPRVS